MLLTACACSTIGAFLLWQFEKLLENRNHWTLRLRLARVYDAVLIPYFTIVLLSALKLYWMAFEDHVVPRQLFWQLAVSFISCLIYGFSVLRVMENHGYRKVRWLAWSGSSRTGIPPALVPYVGNAKDWAAMVSSVGRLDLHPVEKFATFATPFQTGVVADPTEVLKARAALDSESDTVWIPSSDEKPHVYEPIRPDQSVSLLWGENMGFRRRCGRGVISVPRALLSDFPRTSAGLDGRPICLAYAILGRNKGLEPRTLICNLEKNNSFRPFEEGSRFWPRPAKTLRGLYREEFQRTFSLLGTSYVTAATELALLLADCPYGVAEDWLKGIMEQQDLKLNHEVADWGATSEELVRLYRGQYAAMLVSLSFHEKGMRLRPELLVYEAVCKIEDAELPSWISAAAAQNRRDSELDQYGPSLRLMIEAIVG